MPVATVDIRNLAQTWNDTGTDFTAIKLNVTDTASGANSKLMDLRVGGTSKFYVEPDGIVGCSGVFSMSGLRRGIALNGSHVAFNREGAGTFHRFGFSPPNDCHYQILNDAGTIQFGASSDVVLARDAANILALRNGANAQAFNIYNTYTDDSNYERGFMRWNSNVLEIGAEANGTGTARSLSLQGATINTNRDIANVRSFTTSGGLAIGPGKSIANCDSLSMSPTWNDAGTDFTAMLLNVTDTASGANSKLLDLQAGGTSQFCVSKSGGITNKYLVADGVTIGAAFAIGGAGTNQYSLHCGDANTATADYLFWSPGTPNTNINARAGTSSVLALRGTGLKLSSTASISWGATHAGRDSMSNTVLNLYQKAADQLIQRRDMNPQGFYLANTWTDASNNELGFIRWNGHVFEIGAEAAGTGTLRKVDFKTYSGSGIKTGSTDADDIEIYNPTWTLSLDQSALALSPSVPIDVGRLSKPCRDIFLRPSSSLTPSANGDLCIEATNDTTLTFKYKGSDGTVRGHGLPLAGSSGYTQAQNFAQTTLTDAASIAWAVDTNQASVVTLEGNRTLANPTGMKAGGTYILVVKQDATGSRTLTFDMLYKFPGGIAPTLSTGANAKDLLTFYYDGEHMLCVDAKDFQ